MIVERLSVQDVLNFWIAFPNVPDHFPQNFWRSRFARGMEFGHIFEIRDLWDTPNIHWYAIFWRMKDFASSSDVGPSIRNRRRILSVVDQMIDVVLEYVGLPLEGDKEGSLHPIVLETDGFVAHQKQLALPSPAQIKTLHVSTTQLSGRQYVCGLRINDSQKGLGYFSGHLCETFQVAPSQNGYVQKLGCYMDCMGVRGIYVTTESGWTTGIIPESHSMGRLSQGVLPLGQKLIGYFDVCGPDFL